MQTVDQLYLYELVNIDTDEVVASYLTRAEADAHHARYPRDMVRPMVTEDAIGAA